MRRIGLHAVAGVAGTAAIIATGCTSLHQAGGLVGVNKQVQLASAVASPDADSVPMPPIPPTTSDATARSAPASVESWGGPIESSYGAYREPGCQDPPYGEPTCQAPFLREPTCEAPIWQEPTCAGPGMGPARNGRSGPCNQGPCQCANCAKEEHIHETVPAPEQEHGCLTFGGGHVSIPLPTIQFPGFFRVPAFRQALVPVAEATFVGVPTAPAVAAAPVATVAAAQVVPVAPVATVAAAPVEQAIPVQIVVQEQANPSAATASAASAPCETVTVCKDELMALMIKAGISTSALNGSASAAAASGTPTPAPEASQQEINALRTEVQKYQDEIDALIRDIKAQNGQN